MTPAEVLTTIDNSMGMKNGDWLENHIKSEKEVVLLDLRGKDAWEKEHIKGSHNVQIQELPEMAHSLIPGKDSTVICICNGSIQSAMATMYLRTQNFENSYNLSGGFSSWVRNERPVSVFNRQQV